MFVFLFSRIITKTITTVAMTTRIANAVPTMIESECDGAAGPSITMGVIVVLEVLNDDDGSGSVDIVLVMEMGFFVDGEHIEPGESLNMSSCGAFELTQATPQSIWLKDAAPSNMLTMPLT